MAKTKSKPREYQLGKKTEDYKIISLRKLSDAADIDYNKLWNFLSGRYKTLTANEKVALCNAAYNEMSKFFEVMGYKMKLERLPKEIEKPQMSS